MIHTLTVTVDLPRLVPAATVIDAMRDTLQAEGWAANVEWSDVESISVAAQDASPRRG